MKEMAHRPLVEWPDGTTYPELDYTRGERVGVAVGFLLLTALIVALIVAPLALGGLLIAVLGQ